MKNTEVSFMYRDGANYKLPQKVVLAGEMPKGANKKIRTAIIDDEYFYPQSIGLPCENFVDKGYKAYDDDPDWFEFIKTETVDKAPTCNLNAIDVYNDLLSGKANKLAEPNQSTGKVGVGPGPTITQFMIKFGSLIGQTNSEVQNWFMQAIDLFAEHDLSDIQLYDTLGDMFALWAEEYAEDADFIEAFFDRKVDELIASGMQVFEKEGNGRE